MKYMPEEAIMRHELVYRNTNNNTAIRSSRTRAGEKR